MKSFRMIAGFVGLLIASAVVVQAETLQAVRVTWPGIHTVWQHGTMYFTSEPTAQGLAAAKQHGVSTVVNLMTSEEIDAPQPAVKPVLRPWWVDMLDRPAPKKVESVKEAQAAQALGLRYEHVPVDVKAPSEDSVARFLNIVKEVNSQNLLIHCDVGGRALTMYAIYLGTCCGYTPEAAVAAAEKAGLKHEGLKKFALAYLKRHAVSTTI